MLPWPLALSVAPDAKREGRRCRGPKQKVLSSDAIYNRLDTGGEPRRHRSEQSGMASNPRLWKESAMPHNPFTCIWILVDAVLEDLPEPAHARTFERALNRLEESAARHPSRPVHPEDAAWLAGASARDDSRLLAFLNTLDYSTHVASSRSGTGRR